MLALLCWFWPAEGVSVWGHNINWPSLSEVMEVEQKDESGKLKEEKPADCTDLANSEKEKDESGKKEAESGKGKDENGKQKAERGDSILTGLIMPNDSIEYLDNFFRALDNAGTKHVRIVHYGDSQLEEDRITSKLRNNLQEQFGGWGVGLQPATANTIKATISQKTRPELPYHLLYASSAYRSKDNKYGPTLSVSHVQGKATVEMSPCPYTNYLHSRQFDHIGALADGEGTIEVVTDDSTYVLVADTLTEPTQLYVDLPKRVIGVKYKFSGRWNVYGLMLDGKSGVSIDNISMRGYSGTTFTLNDRSTLTPFFNQQNVGLIILQFGGNAVPGLKGEKNIASWKENFARQIDFFHRLAPEACILIIGPADMATTVQGKRQTYPQLPNVVQALREAASEHNAAFWSMYDEMGGWNSMLEWVKARPQLAGEDYIHFTHKGADKMGDRLNELLMEHYNAYCLRNGLDPQENAE